MDWLKLSVDLPDHPKVLGLSDRSFRALVSVWCYAARLETNGTVPEAVAKRLGFTARVSDELEAACLVHRNGAGWVIHDWEDHQILAEDIQSGRERRRAQWRESKARARATAKEVRADA